MKTHSLIRTSAYGPQALQHIKAAFDAAWAAVAPTIGYNLQDVERPRTRLTQVILAVADQGIGDINNLKASAIQFMGVSYGRARTTMRSPALWSLAK